MSPSGLVWWDRSVPFPTKRLPPDVRNERDGFVVNGFAASHWSRGDTCVVQVRVTVDQGQYMLGHRRKMRERMDELCVGFGLLHALRVPKCGEG